MQEIGTDGKYVKKRMKPIQTTDEKKMEKNAGHYLRPAESGACFVKTRYPMERHVPWMYRTPEE